MDTNMVNVGSQHQRNTERSDSDRPVPPESSKVSLTHSTPPISVEIKDTAFTSRTKSLRVNLQFFCATDDNTHSDQKR